MQPVHSAHPTDLPILLAMVRHVEQQVPLVCVGMLGDLGFAFELGVTVRQPECSEALEGLV
jgi:hypothetical protein